ncbi:hypothetical protein D3C78_1084050 [compost metagenome]
MPHNDRERTCVYRDLIERIDVITVVCLTVGFRRAIRIKGPWLGSLIAAGNQAALILDHQGSEVARVRDCTDAQDEIEDACLGPGKTPSEDVLHGLLTV